MAALSSIHTPSLLLLVRAFWNRRLFDSAGKSPRTFGETRNMKARSHTGRLNLPPHARTRIDARVLAALAWS